MSITRITAPMRRSLATRLADIDRRIAAMDMQQERDDSVEATALMMELTRERSDIADALRDATLIDDEPFDTEAIEIGDRVTIRDSNGTLDSYVLVDRNVGARARSDWVSASSPIGAAILGGSIGDEVHVRTPGGTASYVIVDFERASEEPVGLDGGGETVPARAGSGLPSEIFVG